MNITLPTQPYYLPTNFPDHVYKSINVCIDKKKIVVPHDMYKYFTVYTLLEKMLGNKEKTVYNEKIIYTVDATTSNQIGRIINRIALASKYSEIVSLWFKYRIIRPFIATQEEYMKNFFRISHIPVDSILNSVNKTNFASFYLNRSKNPFYCCVIALAPRVFLGKSVVQRFYISSKTYQFCQSDLPFSLLIAQDLNSKYSEIDLSLTLKPVIHLYNAFRFYLWTKPSLIDIAPDFSLIVEVLRKNTWNSLLPLFPIVGEKEEQEIWNEFEFDVAMLKESLKFFRPDLLAVANLIVPEVFALDL